MIKNIVVKKVTLENVTITDISDDEVTLETNNYQTIIIGVKDIIDWKGVF
jgi:hypothetical protein